VGGAPARCALQYAAAGAWGSGGAETMSVSSQTKSGGSVHWNPMPHGPIHYCVRSSTLGKLLVAATGRGVCFVRFGARDAELRKLLEREFPFGEFSQSHRGTVRGWADAIVRYVDGGTETLDVPLDVRGSQFQKRVWSALRRIPRGQTRAYSEIAGAVGQPRGARAVAGACAANPVPVVTPCHRVIEKTGALGGYGGGVRRKRALLKTEGAR
jgi:AraC family transcriptional regulator of adaptative response/methylated-DNA-[protein]-cysteine methyltransferase